MNLSNYPSATEFRGYYNSPEKPNLRTQARIPQLVITEVKEVSAAIYQIIFRYANNRHYSYDETKQYYDMCISEQLIDRTINISFIHPDDCTLNLITHLQHCLKCQYRLWRVCISGSAPDTTVLIYPDVVRYGDATGTRSPQMDVALFTALIAREKMHRGSSWEYTLQQYQSLGQMIPAALNLVNNNRLILLGRFDNYRGDGQYFSIWSLCSQAVADIDLLTQTEYMLGDKFLVKANGDFGYHVCSDAPYWTRQWVLPKLSCPHSLQFNLYDQHNTSSPLDVIIPPLQLRNELS